MPTLTEWIIIFLLIIAIVLLVNIILRKPNNQMENDLEFTRQDINQNIGNTVTNLGSLLSTIINQFAIQQSENGELLSKSLQTSLKQISEFQNTANIQTEQKLENIRQSVEKSLSLASQLSETKLENIRTSVVNSLNKLQEENAKKLDEIRNTVDEKLQKTLEDRISKSFEIVSERLEQVYKGLGEMQTLATGVGDLKKVLTNVKTRGALGEIQLGNILEQILSPEQYDKNVCTKKGSKTFVEFAIKLPGDESPVYLPIDAKFPLEDYQKLLEAYESSPEDVKKHLEALKRNIKNFAKDINEKYIDVPNTTEFGIMFLPVEGLYAEVVKIEGLVEELQRVYKINVSGPTTMAALLNSLQMGFKTLAIQKQSSEVWKILGAVKSEFNNFGKVLQETQKKLTAANEDLDKLVGVRTRKIQSQLNRVETTHVYLPTDEQGD